MSALSDELNAIIAIDPSANAIEYKKAWFTWGELKQAVDRIRVLLRSLSLGEDARVGVMVQNRPDSVAAVLAIVGIDACMVSINPLMPEERIIRDVGMLKLPVVIGERADFERPGILDALRAAGTAVIELDPTLRGAKFRDGYETFDAGLVKLTEPGVIIEMLTSGTTGAPKRIPLKRDAFEAGFISALSYEKGRKPGDPPILRSGIKLIVNPMTHIGGLWHVLFTVAGGRQMYLQERFTVEDWRDAVVRHKPKIVGLVPAAARMVLDANVPKEDLASLVAVQSGTAPLDPTVTVEFMERYNLPILQTYGATEFAGAVAGWTLPVFKEFWREKLGSVGRFQPGVEARVVEPDTGRVLPPGEEGVLQMKSAQFGNGGEWLLTTDRAVIDSDGFLFIRGRADNAIIRGGFKVHPDDVVKAIEAHPSVREAVVVGTSDRRLGATPVAAIMLKSGMIAPADDDMKAFLKERLLPYQVPVRFLYVEDVPRTPSLKPALAQVRALFENEDA